MIQNNIKTHLPLSLKLVECIFLWFTTILSFFAIFTVISQLTGISFHLYSYCSLIAITIITLIIAFVSKKYLKGSIKSDFNSIIFLFIISLVSAGLTSACHRSDPDDYYYVPNALYHLEHPRESLDFFVHSLDYTNGRIISHIQGTSLAFEYMQAAFAYVFKQRYLFIYYIISPTLIGFLIPLGLFYLFSLFSHRIHNVLIAVMMSIVIILLLGETHRTFGNFFLTRAFQGKTVCLTIGVFLFTSYTLRFFRNPSLFYWICLFMTITGMVGLTASTLILFPPLAIILIISSLISKELKSSFLFYASYSGAFVYLGGYVFFVLTSSVVDLGINSPINYGWPRSFWGHANFFYNPHKPITVIVVMISTVLAILLSKKAHRIFFGSWIVLVICLYLNPIVAPFLIRHLTTPNVYWRMFYLYPFPLLLGISIMELLDRLNPKWQLRGCISVSILLCIFHVLPSSPSAFHYGVQFAIPHYKVPDRSYLIAHKAIAIAPRGTMLAPPEICGIIPMLSSAYPQIRIREDQERLWLGKAEAELRIRASNFVGKGEPILFPAFKILLEQWTSRLQSIVMKTEVFNKPEVKELLGHYGFDSYQHIDEYIILWRS